MCTVAAAVTDLITLADIELAAERGKSVVAETPLLPSATFSRLTGRDVWLKAEILQRAGSFKIRGAMNAIAAIEDRSRGVVAASAGNHAQGVALAATTLGTAATVFMPVGAALPKIEATGAYGAEVRLHGEHIGEAVEAAREFAANTGAHFVHPYDDPAIIAGQATLGVELAEQMPGPGTVVVPIGGGGLIAGVATALHHLAPGNRVIGVEASATACYSASRAAGEPVAVEPRFTLADGIRAAVPSEIVFRHIEANVDHLVAVDDGAMAEAVAMLLERSKLLVEAAGAASMAALLGGLVPEGPGPTVLVLSGGNVDLLLLDRVLRRGLEGAGRFGSFTIRVPDVPGQLARVTKIIAEHRANVVAVDHRRQGIGLPFGQTEIRFSVETRDAAEFGGICAALGAMGIEVVR